MVFQFNNITLDTKRYQILRDGQALSVEPLVFSILDYLIRNRDRVISRDELIENLWQGKIVTESAINARIKNARQAVGDDGHRQEVIKTFHGIGYQFVAEVSQSQSDQEKVSNEIADESSENNYRLALPEKPSIAILPLFNMSGELEQEYFSDGISEDLITELSHFSELFVIARNSSFQFRGEAIDIRRVSQELGVRYVLEGSVRRSDNRVRITVQLIDSLGEKHIWAERYDRILEDVFSLQDDIVRHVVSNVASQVSAAEFARSKSRPTKSLSAYEYLLRAKHSDSYGSVERHLLAREYCEKAVSIDPEYAEALAQLATITIVLYYLSDMADGLDKAIEYAERAVVADKGCAEAHGALGWCLLDTGNHKRAGYHFDQALKINPNSTSLLGKYGNFLGVTGQNKKALSVLESAIRRDPLHPDWLYDALGEVYWLGALYQDSIAAYEKLRTCPYWVHSILASCYAFLGHDEKAQVHASAFKDALIGNDTVESELEYWMTRFQHEDDKSRFLEGWRKAGIVD